MIKERTLRILISYGTFTVSNISCGKGTVCLFIYSVRYRKESRSKTEAVTFQTHNQFCPPNAIPAIKKVICCMFLGLIVQLAVILYNVTVILGMSI